MRYYTSKKELWFNLNRLYTKANKLYNLTNDQDLMFCMYALTPYVKDYDLFIKSNGALVFGLIEELKAEIERLIKNFHFNYKS